MKRDKLKTVEEYIKSLPKGKQTILQDIHRLIVEVAPNAEEAIRHRIPTYKQNGVLLSLGMFDKHIGLYPTPSGIANFKTERSGCDSAKGSVQVTLDRPMLIELIKYISKFRVN